MTALSLGEVSKLLRIRSNRVAHAVTQGYVKEPMRVAHRRIFQKENVLELAQHFGVVLKDDEIACLERGQ
jgi:hypothetical protein